MQRTVCRCLLAVLWTALSVAASPVMKAVPRQGEVKIDGALADAAWSQAAWQTDFLSASAAADNAGQPRPVAVQTRFKVLYDASAVYVAVECDEPQIDKLKANYAAHDNEVYQDDCVELFMDPAGDGRYYHHFVVNAKGAWYDDYGADYGLVHVKRWECPLQAAGSVDAGAKVWRCEVRIPLAALQLKPDAGSTWLWNVTRERHATGQLELSTWSPLKGNFHQPKLFAKLTDVKVDYARFAVSFGEPKVTVSGGGSGINAVELKVPVTNNSPQPRTLLLSAEKFLAPETAVKAAAVELAPGATQTVTLAGLKVRAGESDAAIQLTATDTVLGEPARIIVKRLDAEYRPLVVDVLQPVYRGNIYATATVPALVFRVTLADDVAARTSRVTYGLRAAAGEIRSGTATPAQLGADLQLEAATLPVGTYTLAVHALGKGDAVVAEASSTIRKLAPAPGSEVRVDEKGNVLVNGKAKVFCGWYGGIPLEDPRADVVALQDLSTPVVLPGIAPEDVAKSVGEPFRKHGIYSIVSIEPGRFMTTFKLWQKPGGGKELIEEIKTLSAPSAGMQEMLRQVVAAVRQEPGLLGYYLADEPEINDARSDWMEATYAFMQELDPYHPLMVTNDTLDGIVTHGYKTCDLLSPDPYSAEWEYVPNFMKRCQEVLRRGQAIMMTPWASSASAHFNVEYGLTPPYPYEVMRHQYLTALAQGCKGFTAYVTPFFMPEPRLRYGLPPIWREVRFLEAAAANPVTPPTVKADAEMIAWAGQADGKLYLIVSNLKAGGRSATISHPLLKGVAELYVASEGRTVKPAADGSFTDRFEEGAVHVYSTAPAAQKLATTASVAANIKAQEAACVRPGNLLHWSRGVLARSGEGFYAPWFTQYYYYAINGILDDDGWCLSHTHKPCTLELTLPREEKIGRVVLYTPNLLDFDLQLQAADGSIQVATVRGNRTPQAEIRLAAPQSVLKLRVTALAKADGAGVQGVKVREIEAYADAGAGPTTPLQSPTAMAQAPVVAAPAAETASGPLLWREDFTRFTTAAKYNWDGKDDKWVLNAEKLKMAPKTGGGVVLTCTAPEGYAGASHFFPYDKAYRYYQLKISDIAGDGYRWLVGMFGDSSGKPGFRGGVHSLRPGIYTVDTHYVNPIFRDGTATKCFLTLSTAGSSKRADGTIKPGPAFTVDWLQLVRRPQDGLAVTLADGSPLPDVLKQGDELLFRLFLEQPALDATVEVSGGSNYTPIPLNGQNSLQLLRTGAKDGKEWVAQVKLGPGTGTFDGSTGYPVFFRAVITGGQIKDTYGTAALKFE